MNNVVSSADLLVTFAPRRVEHAIVNGNDQLQQLALLALLAYHRNKRGEFLHAQQYLGTAIDELLRLLRRCAHGGVFARINYASPRRRIDTIAPSLARELLSISLGTEDAPEARLLAIAERELRARAPELCWDEVVEVQTRLRGG